MHYLGGEFERARLAQIEILHGVPVAARERLAPLPDRPGLKESEVTDMLPTIAVRRFGK
jgi:hypothetical protein